MFAGARCVTSVLFWGWTGKSSLHGLPAFFWTFFCWQTKPLNFFSVLCPLSYVCHIYSMEYHPQCPFLGRVFVWFNDTRASVFFDPSHRGIILHHYSHCHDLLFQHSLTPILLVYYPATWQIQLLRFDPTVNSNPSIWVNIFLIIGNHYTEMCWCIIMHRPHIPSCQGYIFGHNGRCCWRKLR